MTNNRSQRQKSRQKVAVLVLGMHRSGTSMLGGVLDRLGCGRPKSPMPPNDDNSKGYFESLEVMKLNDAILDALGSRWDDWQQLENGWQDFPRFVEFRERIETTMAAEYGDASLIYLKDPRICRLIPIWREALVESGYAPVCIHTYRNPLEVLQSLAAREEIIVEPEVGLLLWLRHILDAEAGSRGLPRIFTSYVRLLSDWTEFSDRAEDAFGFTWPVARNVRHDLMSDMIDRSLRHHDASAKDPRQDPSVPKLIKQCLEVMERWAGEGEDEPGRATLDRIATEFDASAALFAGSVVGLSGKYKAARVTAERLETLSHSLKQREMTIDAQIANMNALADERDNLAAQDADRLTEIESMKVALDTLRHEKDSLAAREAEKIATIEALNAELGRLRDERDSIGNERDILTAEVAAFIEVNISQGRTLSRLNAELAAITAGKAAWIADADALPILQADAGDANDSTSLPPVVVQLQSRPLWAKAIFRPSGKPKKAFRRILFHKSGKPRDVFRKWVLLPDGRPRAAFHLWMSSREYQSLHNAVPVSDQLGK
ncbi:MULTISPECIES: hypothetical protein [unclassified Yoonia]|uniref:sulfotransferase family protein n=1 Tax=unclassified Yoonia TaxID=2629118 RepID=UPI002AFF32F7|nr:MULTISPECIES: hypothetical protein [unclassified Yoonia]